MFEQVMALSALAETGTMRAAGTKLHVSQSAISKRVASLESELDAKLVERQGRRAVLTPEGERLLERVQPLLSELRAALSEEEIEGGGRIAIGVSESILGSWGAELLARTCAQVPELEIELHAHRSPVAVDRVRGGEYALALCAGVAGGASELVIERLLVEPMVIVPSGLEPTRIPRRGPIDVLTLDTHSETWRSIASSARALRVRPVRTVENAFAAAAMARAGLGHGLVPIGVSDALHIPRDRLLKLPRRGLARPIALVARKSTFARPSIRRFVEVLRVEISAWEARSSRPDRRNRARRDR
jgi:DNA-binding transcriptional LysR family regulator